MPSLKDFLVLTLCIGSAVAVHIDVASSGGNATGNQERFGHAYGYGFLHEVS